MRTFLFVFVGFVWSQDSGPNAEENVLMIDVNCCNQTIVQEKECPVIHPVQPNQRPHSNDVVLRPDPGHHGKFALPPFQQAFSLMRFSKRFHLGACLAYKDMSTIITGALCYLEDPAAFKRAGRKIHTEMYGNRYCKQRIERLNMDQWSNEFNRKNDYTLFTIVREPIERLLSVYVDKCITLREKALARMCYGCGGNLECFINRMSDKLYQFARTRKVKLNDLDLHVMPQTWNCDMKKYLHKFQILKYVKRSSPQFPALVNEIKNLLRNSKVPQPLIAEVERSLQHNSPHATVNLPQRKRYERELYSKPHLLRKLVNIYYYDYVTFDYPIPKV